MCLQNNNTVIQNHADQKSGYESRCWQAAPSPRSSANIICNKPMHTTFGVQQSIRRVYNFGAVLTTIHEDMACCFKDDDDHDKKPPMSYGRSPTTYAKEMYMERQMMRHQVGTVLLSAEESAVWGLRDDALQECAR